MKNELLIALLMAVAVTAFAGFGYYQHGSCWMGSEYKLVNAFWAVALLVGVCCLVMHIHAVLSGKDREYNGIVLSVHIITAWIIFMLWDIHPPSMREQIIDAVFFWVVFSGMLHISFSLIELYRLPEAELAKLANSEDPD